MRVLRHLISELISLHGRLALLAMEWQAEPEPKPSPNDFYESVLLSKVIPEVRYDRRNIMLQVLDPHCLLQLIVDLGSVLETMDKAEGKSQLGFLLNMLQEGVDVSKLHRWVATVATTVLACVNDVFLP